MSGTGKSHGGRARGTSAEESLRSGDRAKGRAQWTLAAAVGAVALAVAGVLIANAEASTESVKAAKTKCESAGGELARCAALEDLRAAGTSDARKAIEDLADSTDDRVAAPAIAALGRSDHSGARAKLKSIAGDKDRSHAARSTAMTAWLRLEKRDGKSWADIKSQVANWAEKGSLLEEQADAVKSAVFGVTSKGEK